MKTAKPIGINPKVNIEEKYKDRVRHGKTERDHKSGAHAARFKNQEKPIRCTSSHKMSTQDNRGPEFWCG